VPQTIISPEFSSALACVAEWTLGLKKEAEARDVATITAPGKLTRFAETLFLHELSNSLLLQFKPRDGL
jgi:hypothetical protein